MFQITMILILYFIEGYYWVFEILFYGWWKMDNGTIGNRFWKKMTKDI